MDIEQGARNNHMEDIDLDNSDKPLANKEKDDDDDDDDDNAEFSQNMSGTSALADTASEEKEKIVFATSETKTVGYLRIALMLVLLAVAASVSFAVFWFSYTSEKEEFETYATETCKKVVSTFEQSAARRLEAIDSFAVGIASNAADKGEVWPNVTVPDLEERMNKTLDLAEVISIILIPIVTAENLAGWIDYSIQHQGWLKEGLAYQARMGLNHSEWQVDLEKAEAIFAKIPNNEVWPGVFPLGQFETQSYDPNNYTSPNPVLPWWQFAPVFPLSSLVNYDTLTHGSRKYQLQAIIENPKPLVSEAFDYSDDDDPKTAGKKVVLNLFLKGNRRQSGSYRDGPVSDLYYPIFDKSKDTTTITTTTTTGQDEEKKLVSVLTAYVYWQVYFQHILPQNTKPVVAVLESICGARASLHEDEQIQQQFTYEIRGDDAVYVGAGDLHDRKFDYLEENTGFNAFLKSSTTTGDDDLREGQCIYNVRAYPSQEMEDSLRTTQPINFMLIILSTFVVTSIIFLVYDYYVERRQKIVLNKAIKSTAVVQSLFPEQVRERLFEETNKSDGGKGSLLNNKRKTIGGNSDATSSAYNTADMSGTESEHLGFVRQGPAVADLYENCTVLFADIHGFTAWCSTREPVQVFTLLESLYGAFDRIAKRRRVFKVETIGDCYLACTGVIRPQKDHALIMAKFASDCLDRMNHLVHSTLAEMLGQGTEQLKLRIGIHSGSVTAGVLRGDRARFQLFGDTVNTASRMESTGVAGRIQVSAETAELLQAAQKESWLKEREGGVEAKGKGNLITFWMQPRRDASTFSGDSTTVISVLSGQSGQSVSADYGRVESDDDDDHEDIRHKTVEIDESGGSAHDDNAKDFYARQTSC